MTPDPSGAQGTFTQEEGGTRRGAQGILSHAMWQRAYGGDDSAAGRDIRINGTPHQIVGVMPADFSWMDPAVDLWIPLAFTAEQRSDDAWHNNSYTMVGRLRSGATLEQARQQVDALNARNLDRFPALKQILVNAGFHTVVRGLQEFLISEARPMLLLLWGGVLFVLAIGIVNITNLGLPSPSAWSLSSLQRWASTACSPIRWPSGGGRSASGWRSAASREGS